MSKQDNGGPAFPRVEPSSGGSGPTVYFGMTLRDYFAGQFLTSVVIPEGHTVAAQDVAAVCYRMADAMLAERAK